MIYAGFPLIVIGLGFIASGTLGLFRFKGFYNKLHAASVIECCGIPFCLVGLSLIQVNFSSSFKLILMALLILLLNPVSTHALARASLPAKADQKGRFK